MINADRKVISADQRNQRGSLADRSELSSEQSRAETAEPRIIRREDWITREFKSKKTKRNRVEQEDWTRAEKNVGAKIEYQHKKIKAELEEWSRASITELSK